MSSIARSSRGKTNSFRDPTTDPFIEGITPPIRINRRYHLNIA